jgi:hypothetical protein
MQTRPSALQIVKVKHLCSIAAALLSAAVLSACGGGGGSSAEPVAANPVVVPPVLPPVAPPTGVNYPVAAVVSTFVQTSHTFVLTGTLGGKSSTLTDEYTTQANTTFDGKPALAGLQTTTIRQAGAVTDVTKANLFFTINPYVQLGSTDPDGPVYVVTNQTSNLPATAKIGESGALGVATNYTNSTKTTVADTAVITWTLETDTGANALLCIVTAVGGRNPITGYECLRIDSTGRVLGKVIKAVSGGLTITFS